MLTRLRFKRDFRIISRFLADKPSDSDAKPALEKKTKAQDGDKTLESSTEKIQALLKSMMAEPKINEKEYRENFVTAPEIPRRKKSDVLEVKMEKIEESLTMAAGEVAEAIGGNVKQTEAELLSKVLGKINQTSTSLSDLIIGMKVDRSKEPDDMKKETRGQHVRRLVDKSKVDAPKSTRFDQRRDREPRPERRDVERKSIQATKVNIFGAEPLGIFKTKGANYGTELAMWETLKQREVTLATSQPPANYFQKMIMWTEQGKVWKFPIDNEQGMEEEQNVHFSEHVFLDALLEDWCPNKGPIKHFMELVCVGLSKNPFYTIQEKKDHIMWYKEYFESKKDILSDVGAWDSTKSSNTEASV